MKHYMPKDKSKEDSVLVMKYLAMRRTAQIFDTGRRLIVDALVTDDGVRLDKRRKGVRNAY